MNREIMNKEMAARKLYRDVSDDRFFAPYIEDCKLWNIGSESDKRIDSYLEYVQSIPQLDTMNTDKLLMVGMHFLSQFPQLQKLSNQELSFYIYSMPDEEICRQIRTNSHVEPSIISMLTQQSDNQIETFYSLFHTVQQEVGFSSDIKNIQKYIKKERSKHYEGRRI